MLLRSPLRAGAPEEHPRVGAPQEPGSVLLRSRSQGPLLSGAAISHHPEPRATMHQVGDVVGKRLQPSC